MTPRTTGKLREEVDLPCADQVTLVQPMKKAKEVIYGSAKKW